ncbi:hypothetical protein [Kinneretia aquatilis]|uniref:hypothetical protein n=1 Tax=Kinneretia aquatilis TaxID=2070761 RepID=UPI0014951505|nr:hypothetical protein [Paucibacter aquatile]WIV97976.1 hypothetical protein K9V56_000280 [Paucibacter aquatile]
MLTFLGRCIFFFLGSALLADVALPTRIETLLVEQHTSQTQTAQRSTPSTDSRWADTSYKLHLSGGGPSSCSVAYSTYSKLKDGDSIEVRSSKVFRTCVHIARGEEVFESDGLWKWIALFSGLLLIAASFGWVKSDSGDGEGFSIRF